MERQVGFTLSRPGEMFSFLWLLLRRGFFFFFEGRGIRFVVWKNLSGYWVKKMNRRECVKKNRGGFPGGAVVENLPANAGDTGSSPGLRRSHVPQSSWAREPQLLSLRVWSLCSATREATIVRGPCTTMKSGPRSPQLEKALAQKQRPNIAKNK